MDRSKPGHWGAYWKQFPLGDGMMGDVGREPCEKWNCGTCGRWGEKSRLCETQCGALVCPGCRRYCDKCKCVMTQSAFAKQKGLCEACRPQKKVRR